MGLSFSQLSARPVLHEVQYRSLEHRPQVPGLPDSNYVSVTGQVLFNPVQHQTLSSVKVLLLQEFSIVAKAEHQFVLLYSFARLTPETQLYEVLASSNIRELIENPEVRFVFSYINQNPSLLEHRD